MMFLEGSLAGDAQLPGDLRPRPAPRTRGAHLRPLQLVGQLPQGGNGAQTRPGIPGPGGGGQGDGLVVHIVNLGWQRSVVNLSWQQPTALTVETGTSMTMRAGVGGPTYRGADRSPCSWRCGVG